MTNLKPMIEARNEQFDLWQKIVDKAASEKRPYTEEEEDLIADYKAKIDGFDATIENARELKKRKVAELPDGSVAIVDVEAAEKQAQDIKNLSDYIRFKKDVLDNATQMKTGGNGAVIPTTIADKIIERVKEYSPLYRLAHKYYEKGDLKIPVVDTSTDDVTIEFVSDEMDTPDSHVNGFTSITLSGYVYRAKALISKKMINNAAFDLVEWMITYFAKKIAYFFEKALIGSASADVKGILGSYDTTNMKVVTASKSAVAFDEMIDLQEKIVEEHQADSVFIMTRDTRKALRKAKDADGRYLLNYDPTMPYGFSILGKPVYLTENLGSLGTASANLIIYGDPSGLAVKEPKAYELQVLYELYSAQGAVGIHLFGEMDSKVEDKQAFAVMVAAAS